MNRILTPHVGSLPRSQRVTELIFAHELGSGFDPVEYETTMADAVRTVVAPMSRAKS